MFSAVKFILPLVTSFILMISNLMDQDVNVTLNYPKNTLPRSKFLVSIKIQKDDDISFAKYSQSMPKGVNIKIIDAKGGFFSFHNQEIKILWSSLPEMNEFEVKYEVEIVDIRLKLIIIEGQFIYLKNNKKRIISIPNDIIKISIDPEIYEIPEIKKDHLIDIRGERPITNRTIEQLKKGVFNVSLDIKKGFKEGFAKIEEIIPFNAKITIKDSLGAISTVEENKVKFIWMDKKPLTNTISVSYQIETNKYTLEDIKERIEGQFIYLKLGRITKVPIQTIGGPIYEGDNSDMVYDELISKINENGFIENPVKTVESEQNNNYEDEDEDTEVLNEINNTKSVNKEFFYRVQILAAHFEITKNHIQSRYKFYDKYDLELHEGWKKCLVKKYKTYKEARDARNEINKRYDFPGPFVVAYNQGKRITVREALNISGQKWYK